MKRLFLCATLLSTALCSCTESEGLGPAWLQGEPQSWDVGLVATGEERSTTVTLRNTGWRTAQLGDLDLPASETGISVGVDLPQELAPDEELALELAQEGSETAFVHTELSLAWYDLGEEHHWALPVWLRRVEPRLVAGRERLDFGPLDWGESNELDLSLAAAPGIGATIVSLDLSSEAFALESAPALPHRLDPDDTLILGLSATAPPPGAGEPPPVQDSLTIVLEHGPALQIVLVFNDCANSSSSIFDADGDLFSICAGDCDDTSRYVNPGSIDHAAGLEFQGIDNDCDGQIDEESGGSVDDDGDGFCENPNVCADGSTPGDCHDQDAGANPSATEIEDGLDNDCDGLVDEGSSHSDDDDDGWTEDEGDCNDSLAAINPGAVETDNGDDDNCDGRIDEGLDFTDEDGDGYPVQAATPDCDDTDASIHPAAIELCSDEIDNNCDGSTDAEDEERCRLVQRLSVASGCRADVSSTPPRGGLMILLIGACLVGRRRRN